MTRRGTLRSLGSIVAITGLLLPTGGCLNRTFRSHRITDECKPFRGVPTLVNRTHLVTVEWEKGGPTKHLAALHVLYGVDVIKAPLGTTTGTFKFTADGGLSEAHAVLDQQIDEIINAAANVIGNLPEEKARMAALSEDLFVPSLPEDRGAMTSIQFQLINEP